jgi:hypothetical protein
MIAINRPITGRRVGAVSMGPGKDARRMGRHRSPMSYFTNAGPAQGPFLHRDVPDAIDVLDAPDEPTLIGTALCLGANRVGVAV